jgi:hypothetical protein
MREHRRHLVPFLLALLSLRTGSALAAELCVNPLGSDGCFATIGDAIVAGATDVAPDSIAVAAGTFPGFEVPEGRSVRIQGAGVGSTVIDWVDTGYNAKLKLSDVTIAAAGTAGVHVARGAQVELSDCDIVQTVSGFGDGVSASNGGAVSGPTSKLRLRRCSVHGFEGGLGFSRGRAWIEQSAIYDNSLYGVGIHAARVTVSTSTVSGNGEGVRVDNFAFKLLQSTVAANSGGGLLVNRFGGDLPHSRVLIEASIIADNGSPSEPNCTISPFARVRSNGFNLVDDNDGCIQPELLAASDLTGMDPLLEPLAANGGPTPTHALMAGSPALARVTRRAPCREPDQRGVVRAAPCDTGAFEGP